MYTALPMLPLISQIPKRSKQRSSNTKPINASIPIDYTTAIFPFILLKLSNILLQNIDMNRCFSLNQSPVSSWSGGRHFNKDFIFTFLLITAVVFAHSCKHSILQLIPLIPTKTSNITETPKIYSKQIGLISSSGIPTLPPQNKQFSGVRGVKSKENNDLFCYGPPVCRHHQNANLFAQTSRRHQKCGTPHSKTK